MAEKIKRIGTVVFVSSFAVSFIFESLRDNALIIMIMIGSLLVTAAGYHISYRENEKQKISNSVILYNGKIHTVDKHNTVKSAVFIENNLIKDIGKDDSILSRYGMRSEIKIDLEGKTVLPGFNDSHIHLCGYGDSLVSIDLTGIRSLNELILKGKEAIESGGYQAGEWLIGRGWNQELFVDKRMPSREDLDSISTVVPIAFTRVCNHMTVINSKAAEIIGINDKTHVTGGEVERDYNGVFTGILIEKAMLLVRNRMKKASVEDVMQTIERAQEKLISFGITSVQTDDLQYKAEGWETVIKAYVTLFKQKKLKIRVNEQCLFYDIDEFKIFLAKGGHGIGMGKNFRTGPLKLLGDGSLGGRTALLYDPYQDDASKTGISAFSQQQLDEFISLAHQNKMPVAVHAIGDRMIDMAMEAIDKSRKSNKVKKSIFMRDGIVHCQITTEAMLDRCKDLELIAYIQPIFTTSDWKIAHERVGIDRSSKSYNWKTMLNKGIIIAMGTDAPVESPNPFENIYAAVTRKDFDGQPPEGWMPEQRLNLEEAIRAYTDYSAHASGEEKEKGTLEKGKLADLIVINEDIFNMNPDEIRHATVYMTMIDGEIVYSRKTN
ncbi:MAG: amidohydrolase [Eubacteriales bacterium]|nr:amidohydrolase [Eubacteriales bacterium]